MFSRDFSRVCSSSLFRLHTCYSWADSKAATPLIALFLHGLHKIYLTCVSDPCSEMWNWILKTVKQCNMQHWKHHSKFTSNVVTWHIQVSDIDHLWQMGIKYQIIAGYILLIKASSSLTSVIIQSVTFLVSHMVPLHAGLFMHVYRWSNFWQWCWVNSVFWSFNFFPANNTLLWSDYEFKLCQYTSLIV